MTSNQSPPEPEAGSCWAISKALFTGATADLHFEVYEDKGHQWRFRLTAGNGEIVAVGKSNPTRANAERGCEAVKRAASDAPQHAQLFARPLATPSTSSPGRPPPGRPWRRGAVGVAMCEERVETPAGRARGLVPRLRLDPADIGLLMVQLGARPLALVPGRSRWRRVAACSAASRASRTACSAPWRLRAASETLRSTTGVVA